MFASADTHSMLVISPLTKILLINAFLLSSRLIADDCYSLGVVTSTDMCGCSKIGLACLNASLNDPLAAAEKALGLLSTACCSPSCNTYFTLITGYPVRGPVSVASLKPFSIDGTYSLEILVPVVLSSNSH